MKKVDYSLLTREYLLSRVSVDTRKGLIHYLPIAERDRFDRAWNARCAGKLANKSGKGAFSLDGKYYIVSHVIWFVHYGVWPEGLLDHENRDHSDNRVDNLRPASHAQNSHNRSLGRNSTTGYRGVCRVVYSSGTVRYRAGVVLNGKSVYTRYFETAEEAALDVDAAFLRFHGKFASLNFPERTPPRC